MERQARPFTKWPGGKRGLLPELRKFVPATFHRYHEPFIGGGALFYDLQPRQAILSDVNERLMRTYTAVRDDVETVINLLRPLPNDKEFFYKYRTVDTNGGTDAEVAAQFIYLLKTCFNGLHRVNKSGKFNTPFGSYKNPKICDEETLRTCSVALKNVELLWQPFEVVLDRAELGDFVYFDPPYLPISDTSNFVAYTTDGFGLTEHRRLRDVARILKDMGVAVLLSNSNVPAIHELYATDFEIHEIGARRSINSDANKRGKVMELLIT